MFNFLEIRNLRQIELKKIKPKNGLNLITGNNGSGKTTILEALYILTHGRSFRYRESTPLIREGTTEYCIVAKFISNLQNQCTIGVQCSKKEFKACLNGKKLVRRSEIVNLLPVVCINSEAQLLLTGGPELRRNFLDTSMFHMEPQYLTCFQQYYRALNQRNAALKNQQKLLASWEKVMQKAADKIDSWRQAYIKNISILMYEYIQQWEMDIAIDIHYQRGWHQNMSFLESLNKAYITDNKLKYTSVGPHRADIAIRSERIKSAKRLSRGQLKMLTCALYFSQAKLFLEKNNKNIILLFDDLSAELDDKNKEYLLNDIKRIFPQSFITALNSRDITHLTNIDSQFHMEPV